LLLQVPKNYALHGYGCGGNCIVPKEAGDETEDIAAQPTNPVAAATRPASNLQLRPKDAAMSQLMGAEFFEFTNEITSGKACHEDLARVDADGAMLSSMVYLHDAITELTCIHELRGYFHEA